MQIVKEGRIPPPWSKEAVCRGSGVLEPGCGSVLRVEEADLYVVRRANDYNQYIGYECPFCHRANLLPSDFYPGKISRLPSRKKWGESRRQPAGRGSWI